MLFILIIQLVKHNQRVDFESYYFRFEVKQYQCLPNTNLFFWCNSKTIDRQSFKLPPDVNSSIYYT